MEKILLKQAVNRTHGPMQNKTSLFNKIRKCNAARKLQEKGLAIIHFTTNGEEEHPLMIELTPKGIEAAKTI